MKSILRKLQRRYVIIKTNWQYRRHIKSLRGTASGAAPASQVAVPQGTFLVSQKDYEKDLYEAYNLGYVSGKTDGLATAKNAAITSLKEIIWHQNQPANPATNPSLTTPTPNSTGQSQPSFPNPTPRSTNAPG